MKTASNQSLLARALITIKWNSYSPSQRKSNRGRHSSRVHFLFILCRFVTNAIYSIALKLSFWRKKNKQTTKEKLVGEFSQLFNFLFIPSLSFLQSIVPFIIGCVFCALRWKQTKSFGYWLETSFSIASRHNLVRRHQFLPPNTLNELTWHEIERGAERQK